MRVGDEQALVDERVWISYSGINKHRTCPQKWAYQRLMGLEPLVEEPAVERDFGSWWHALRAAEAMERGRDLNSLMAVPRVVAATNGKEWPGETVTVADVLEGARDLWKRFPSPLKDTWVERIGQDLPGRLADLLDRWKEEWFTDIPYEVPLAVELGWGRDLGQTGYRLVGYVDEVYFDLLRNVVVVRDHKTSKVLSTQSTADDMMDSQLQFYAWGAAPTVAGWGRGGIKAVAYDRARMVAPKPPILTQSGRLAQREGKPSIGQCDLHTYREWAKGPDGLGVPFPGLKKDGSGAGRYIEEEDVVAKLTSPSARSAWFQRTLTPLNSNIVGTHLRSALDTAEQMTRTKERVEATGEAARNLTSGCRWCDFVSLCRAEMIGGPGGEYDLAAYNLRYAEKRQPSDNRTAVGTTM